MVFVTLLNSGSYRLLQSNVDKLAEKVQGGLINWPRFSSTYRRHEAMGGEERKLLQIVDVPKKSSDPV